MEISFWIMFPPTYLSTAKWPVTDCILTLMVITKPSIIFQPLSCLKKDAFMLFYLERVVERVIYVSCHESYPLYFTFFFFFFTQDPEGADGKQLQRWNEAYLFSIALESKLNWTSGKAKRILHSQDSYEWLALPEQNHTLSSFLSLALYRSLSVHSDQLGPSAVLCWHNGMLKILMHKWSMLHCTRLWHMFEHGCWCCCCFLKQEGKNFCIYFWFWLKSRAADDLDHSHVWFMIYSHPGKISTGTTMHLIWHLVTPCGFSPSSLCGVQRLVW